MDIKKLIAAVALLTASFSAGAVTPVKLALTTWIGYSPFYVAEGMDMYKKHGLKVTLQTFADPAMLPSAVAGKAVDGALMTYDQVIGAAAQGQVFKVVMPIDYSNGGDAVLADMSIKTIADLKGKKVAYAPLSPSDFLISYALKINGMSDKNISPVNMTPEAIPSALASKAVPAGVTYEPNVSQILSMDGGKRFHVIYSSKEAPGLIADVLVFDEAYIKKNGKEVAALIQAYLDGLAYLKSHPKESSEIIGKAIGVSGKEVLEQLQGVYNIPLVEMAQPFKPGKDTKSYFVSGEVINQILLKSGQIKKPVAISSTLDDQFVKALSK
ncbi:Putative thiamine biosynthesis protein [Ferriphaselus amnicola]|jgi:NitT/TauT family transport system substrate-binding protein|uniref:Thiamine biosynthesis protein n=1 Tax=Ferriphaselus amnicola TaxID=1188319 RepID=A0A2Z6GC93_9PROT|nr:ABC transporter substrate-binding protein [Ferriphaselus amnicola]BBE51231.1 Putative thiamine biosynthesis protein [Ferriphaselus amnicola]